VKDIESPAVCLERMDRPQRIGFQMGFVRGYDVGHRDARTGHTCLSAAAQCRLDAELARRELQYSNQPCRRPDCRGCSVCTRAAAVVRNVARYGSADYPGSQAAEDSA
jgi:hypothetical protein